MLTPEELRKLNVDYDIAKEALAQSEKRLLDALDSKKAVEQKATVLFGAYVTISLALFGAGAALARETLLNAAPWPFFVAGAIFVIGAGAFARVFKTAEYGNLGSEPTMWLLSGRIDGDKQELARAFAYLAHHHQHRIDISYESNANKSLWLNAGMIAGIAGSAVFLIAGLIYLFCASHP